MRAEHHVPEGLLRDERRGSWIMIVPASEFIAEVHVRERRPDHEPCGESQLFATEVAAIFGLAAVLMYMFWSLAHI